MDKTQKNQIKKIISWVCIAALVTVLAVMPLLAGTGEESDGPEASILSAEVGYQDIDTILIGGGSLASEDALEINIPAAVKLTQYLVSNGDPVSQGDPIACVDRVTVMSAITEVQETMDYLAEEIEEEGKKTAPEEVNTQTAGTVKIIHAQPGDSVLDVMLAHGALAVLSLDGMMAAEIERNTDLTSGDTVCVTFEDGREVNGRVESNLAGILTITVEDDDYAVGTPVKVTTEDGDRIGSGELYIHSQWNATAYSGTVSRVKVTEGKAVSSGTTLMTLEDTGKTALYQQLVNQYRKYEALMLELFKMYQSETIYAPGDGVVYGVDKTGTYMLSGTGTWTVSLLANSPNGDDETTYTNFVGQITEVGTDSLILNMNSQNLSIGDYTDLSGVPRDPAAMTETVTYGVSVPVYERSDGAWVQISADSLNAGDVLLFAFDAEANLVWIVRIQQAETEQPTDPSETTEPSEPSDSENSGETTGPSIPTGSEQSGSQGQMGGAMFGITGGSTREETYELYSLETVAIAAITPRSEMTLEITIDELDIGQVYMGQKAMVSVEALSGETFTATVTQIGNSGTSDGGNAKFTVELTMDCNENMLTGMTASAFITLSTEKNVLTVPAAALNDNGTETYVYTNYDEEKGILGNPVAVTVGVSDGESAQILSGLEEGTTIYYAYYDTLAVEYASVGGTSFAGFSFGGRSGFRK